MKAIERNDEHHIDKHGRILQMKKQMRIETVFLGDSLTRRWEEHTDLWNEYFGDLFPVNFGVGADTLENIYWRITEGGELDGLQPEVLVFMGGTNNLGTNTPEEVAGFIREILETVHRKMENTQILLLGIMPRNTDETGLDYMKAAQSVNSFLQKLPKQSFFQGKLTYLDVGKSLPLHDGKLPQNIAPDGLHLDTDGYKITGPLIADAVIRLRTIKGISKSL